METDPIDAISRSVRRRMRERAANGQSTDTDQVIHEELQRYSESALSGAGPMPDDDETSRRLRATVSGFGALQPLLDDGRVEEIWVNGPDRVFLARNGRTELTDIRIPEEEIRRLVERMLRSSGRRLDLSSPFVDACLPDGSRVHVVIPDITAKHLALNIRKFLVRDGSLAELVRLGSLSAGGAVVLREQIRDDRNVLVCGPTQSGKTTVLRAMLGELSPDDRIVCLEETFELALTGRDVVAMQCRQPSLEGTGEVTLRRLVKETLRMRPDRIVVGEVREAEAFDLLLALNSGVPGMCTMHANSAEDALAKLSVLPLLAGQNVTAEFIAPTIARCIHIVVECEIRGGQRRVTRIAETLGTVTEGRIDHRIVHSEVHR